jgi:hypothetical protein
MYGRPCRATKTAIAATAASRMIEAMSSIAGQANGIWKRHKRAEFQAGTIGAHVCRRQKKTGA